LTRQERNALLGTLEQRVTHFRRHEDIWPFRRPHEPLDLSRLIPSPLGTRSPFPVIDALRPRTVLTMQWSEGETWTTWAITLPSGIHVYGDSDAIEHRVLASAKRGNAMEADRFFLELLAESRGQHFGIEMSGGAPSRITTSIADRAFLAEILVDLLEGTPAEADLRSAAGDFRLDVERWLSAVLVAPPPSTRSKRYPRLRDERPDL
jgi:hypothetical protein